MDSHIQMPKFVLKQFVGEKGDFYKYDVNNGYISVGAPASTNTEKGYYSESVEEKLSKCIETPFSQKIVQKLKNDRDVVFEEQDMESVYNYACSLLFRDPETVSIAQENVPYYELWGKQLQHDIVVDSGMSDEKLRQRLKKEFTPTIMLNETEQQFILPTCGMYSFSLRDTGERFIILPFAKFEAIYFIDNNFIDKFTTKQGDITRVTVNDVEIVNRLNEIAFKQQIGRKSGFVVAHSKALLEQLKNKYAM